MKNISKKHKEECQVLFSVFKQVKELKDGMLKTRNVEELLNECNKGY